MPVSTRELMFTLLGLLTALLVSTFSPSSVTSIQGYVAEARHKILTYFEAKIYEEAPRNDVVGIELGRSYSRVGYLEQEIFEVIVDEQGRSMVSSYLAFNEDGLPIVGIEAEERLIMNPKNTIYDISLLVGRNFSDPSVQSVIPHLTYDIVEKNSMPIIKVAVAGRDIFLSPEEVLAEILKKLKSMAEYHLNKTISSAVITMPYPADEAQRQATKDAASLAGLDVLYIWTEAEAAGLGYGIDTPIHRHHSKESQCFMIFQVEAKESKVSMVNCQDTYGTSAFVRDTSLQESHFDSRSSGHTHFGDRACELITELLKTTAIDKSEVDGLIITGDPSQVAAILDPVEAYLGKKARALHSPSRIPVRSDEAIVRGAALQGCRRAIPERGCTWLPEWEWTALSLGIEGANGAFIPLIQRGVTIPAVNRSVFQTVVKGQDKVVLKVYEGERLLAKENKLRGTIQLSGLTLKEDGHAFIEVDFAIHSTHKLVVSVNEEGIQRGEELVIMIEHSNVEPDEVDEAVKSAEKYLNEDLAQLEKEKYVMQTTRREKEVGVEAKHLARELPKTRLGWPWFGLGRKGSK